MAPPLFAFPSPLSSHLLFLLSIALLPLFLISSLLIFFSDHLLFSHPFLGSFVLFYPFSGLCFSYFSTFLFSSSILPSPFFYFSYSLLSLSSSTLQFSLFFSRRHQDRVKHGSNSICWIQTYSQSTVQTFSHNHVWMVQLILSPPTPFP